MSFVLAHVSLLRSSLTLHAMELIYLVGKSTLMSVRRNFMLIRLTSGELLHLAIERVSAPHGDSCAELVRPSSPPALVSQAVVAALEPPTRRHL